MESPFGFRLRGTFGKKDHLISTFAGESLFFLNQDIYRQFRAGDEMRMKLRYLISFDSNAASYLRDLVAGKQGTNVDDIRELLVHFGGNRLNWDIVPYLLETSMKADGDAKTWDAFFETIVATEKIGDLDNAHFLATGEVRARSSETEILAKAQLVLARQQEFRRSGAHERLMYQWNFLYVCILKCAQLQRLRPGNQAMFDKLDLLIRFMHEELNCVSRKVLTLACFWFAGVPERAIFQSLETPNSETVKNARNITWDILHITMLSKQCLAPGDADFLVPYFLSCDQKLTRLAKICGLRLCLFAPARQISFEVQALEYSELLENLTDGQFFHEYLTGEAMSARNAKIRAGVHPNLCALRKTLETEIG